MPRQRRFPGCDQPVANRLRGPESRESERDRVRDHAREAGRRYDRAVPSTTEHRCASQHGGLPPRLAAQEPEGAAWALAGAMGRARRPVSCEAS